MHIILVYLGILLGIFFEGEMTMISAVVAAHNGYLNLWVVIVLGITGTFGSDCYFFSLGKRRGNAWLAKRPQYQKKVDRIHKNLGRAPFLVFLTYRFLYGFRTITPIIIGTSKIANRKFLILSFTSVILWTSTFTILGYALSDVIMSALDHIQDIEKYVIGGLVLVAILLLVARRVRKKNKKHAPAR